jgi:hypothetical protein
MSAAFAQQPGALDHAAMEKPAAKTAASNEKPVAKNAATGLDSFRKGVGNLHHPVSTKSLEAQAAFDEGLRLAFGFNHDEAVRSFERAAKADPKLAMAYWGIA